MSEEELARVRQWCADYLRLAHHPHGSDQPDYGRLPEIEGLLASVAPALIHEIAMQADTIERHRRVQNYWFPRLGYGSANEMAYPALGDPRARPAPNLE
jgi:hypothetical protein